MLARDLHMTHARLMATMSTREFTMWMGLYSLEFQEDKERK